MSGVTSPRAASRRCRIPDLTVVIDAIGRPSHREIDLLEQPTTRVVSDRPRPGGDQALKFMRAAADGEDGSVKHVAMENRLFPLRELYAELLLEAGQPAAALKEFETALEQTPNRYRTLLGIARAANAAGDRQKASDQAPRINGGGWHWLHSARGHYPRT